MARSYVITIAIDGEKWSDFVRSTEGGRREKWLDDDGDEVSEPIQAALTNLEVVVEQEAGA